MNRFVNAYRHIQEVSPALANVVRFRLITGVLGILGGLIVGFMVSWAIAFVLLVAGAVGISGGILMAVSILNEKYIVVWGTVTEVEKGTVGGKLKHFVVAVDPVDCELEDGSTFKRDGMKLKFFGRAGLGWLEKDQKVIVYIPNSSQVTPDGFKDNGVSIVQSFWTVEKI